MECKMLTVVLSFVLLALCQAATEINLGSGSSLCGSKRLVAKEDELHVYSKGSAPNGVCSIVLHAIEDTTPQCPYRAFCVAVKSKQMNSCAAKLFLTGTDYDITGANKKEVSCFTSIFGAWCTQSKTLQISVLEDPKASADYSFNLTVLSECRNSPAVVFEEDNTNSKKIEDIEAQINANRVIGVVVGVCLACFFLVILFISYNYYKNKPTYRQQRDDQ